jgi:hypothetical protein
MKKVKVSPGKKLKNMNENKNKPLKIAEEHYEKTKTEQQKIFLKPSNLDIPRSKPWQELNRKAFDQRLENLTKRSDPKHFDERLERFRDNYIKSLEMSFNEREVD